MAERGVDLSPDKARSRLALAYAWASNRNTAAAVGEINRAILLDSKNQEARDMLPLIQAGYTMYGGVSKQHRIAFWIENEQGWIYLVIAIAALGLWAVISLIRRRKSSEGSPEQQAELPIWPWPKSRSDENLNQSRARHRLSFSISKSISSFVTLSVGRKRMLLEPEPEAEGTLAQAHCRGTWIC